MSTIHVYKNGSRGWYWSEPGMQYAQPVNTAAFMEGRLGICKDLDATVRVAVNGEPNQKLHIHLADYDIVKVELVITTGENSYTVSEVTEFEFDS